MSWLAAAAAIAANVRPHEGRKGAHDLDLWTLPDRRPVSSVKSAMHRSEMRRSPAVIPAHARGKLRIVRLWLCLWCAAIIWCVRSLSVPVSIARQRSHKERVLTVLLKMPSDACRAQLFFASCHHPPGHWLSSTPYCCSTDFHRATRMHAFKIPAGVQGGLLKHQASNALFQEEARHDRQCNLSRIPSSRDRKRRSTPFEDAPNIFRQEISKSGSIPCISKNEDSTRTRWITSKILQPPETERFGQPVHRNAAQERAVSPAQRSRGLATTSEECRYPKVKVHLAMAAEHSRLQVEGLCSRRQKRFALHGKRPISFANRCSGV